MDYNYLYLYSLIFDSKTSDNGESERKETLIGKVQKFCFPPLPTGFSNIGIKEPPYEERKRHYRNSSSVSQVSAVQAQTSASCYRTPSDYSDRILRHCGRFKNSPNRVPVHKTVMGMKIPCPRMLHGNHSNGRVSDCLTLQTLCFNLSLLFDSIARTKSKALQNYNEYPKHARNVNSVLTYRKQQNLRKIAAKKNSKVCNSLIIKTLKSNSKWNTCQWNIIGDFCCLPP